LNLSQGGREREDGEGTSVRRRGEASWHLLFRSFEFFSELLGLIFIFNCHFAEHLWSKQEKREDR
jgi:hypothetical protein